MFLTISFFSCKKEMADEYQLNEVIYIQNTELFSYNNCFSVLNIHAKSGIVIRDSVTYKMYKDSLIIHPYNTNCDTSSLINIDFNKYSLIGISTDMSLCDTLTKSISTEDKNKLIKYTIDIKEYQGTCVRVLLFPLNFAIISKIPDNYNVEFNVIRH